MSRPIIAEDPSRGGWTVLGEKGELRWPEAGDEGSSDS
jgi:hypothetical protein